MIDRSSRPQVLCKKGVLRNFANFTGKHLCQGLFFNKVAGLRPSTLWKKRLWHSCFPVNVANFLRTPFIKDTSGGSSIVNEGIKTILNLFLFFYEKISHTLRAQKKHKKHKNYKKRKKSKKHKKHKKRKKRKKHKTPNKRLSSS